MKIKDYGGAKEKMQRLRWKTKGAGSAEGESKMREGEKNRMGK